MSGTTEKQAGGKVCYRAKDFNGDPAPPNKTPKCVGSNCMAWRWSRAKETKAFLDAVNGAMKKDPKLNFNTATQKLFVEIGSTFDEVEGYCGLAGKPE